MYTKRVQITNYGPIDRLDIELPFESGAPKPVLLVGENGSGKSIVLSHIVNGLIFAQSEIYPDTPEVEQSKVYKYRSSSYIKLEREFYFAKVDFENGLFAKEMRLVTAKPENAKILDDLDTGDAQDAWEKIKVGGDDFISTVPHSGLKNKIESIFSKNCILYFPPNRFEEPAWLNEKNLKAKAKYVDRKLIKGSSDRKIINYSPLWDNQNWLFDVIFDQIVFERQTGVATNIYQIALQIARSVIKGNENIRFGIGRRLNRVVSIIEGNKTLVPNIFQLSSGETCLLNLFLSILRDFDLSGTPFTKANEIRGVVIVDEIDLHLHMVHQYEILPHLIKMFPRVQFVVTTHSPLFVLGMKSVFGQEGFAVYNMPEGHRISPEEFGEFESSYGAFSETRRFTDGVREAIDNAQKPIVFVEGKTDIKYIQKAAELLSQEELLEKFQLRNAGGSPNLNKVWHISKLPDSLPQKIVLLYDCDTNCVIESRGNMFKKKIPYKEGHPIKKGIENRFTRTTLDKAKEFKSAFINIKFEHTVEKRGEKETIPEEWTVDKDEKSNLCEWLCENGTADDFKYFETIFSLLEEVLSIAPSASG